MTRSEELRMPMEKVLAMPMEKVLAMIMEKGLSMTNHRKFYRQIYSKRWMQGSYFSAAFSFII